MSHRPRLRIVAPGASAEEAAAVVAALEQFIRAGGREAADAEPVRSAWLAAALAEGVERWPDLAPPWS